MHNATMLVLYGCIQWLSPYMYVKCETSLSVSYTESLKLKNIMIILMTIYVRLFEFLISVGPVGAFF
jgi:hypothetical protein